MVQVVESRERPALAEQASESFRVRWPEFIFHDEVSRACIPKVERYFPNFDLWLLEDESVVAGGWGVPLSWDGQPASLPGGYDGALLASVSAFEAAERCDTFCIMAAAVAVEAAGRGLAGEVLAALRDRALAAGLGRVICPVRPTLKSAYPLVPMARFASWRRPDTSSVDPWIRTHERLGATMLGPAARSMVITGAVADWEGWTGMVFPETDRYVVPDALGLVEIDREQDRGTYVEENLWMRHR